MFANDLPQRLRESNFRRFETYIAQIVKSYPNSIEFSPRDYDYTCLTFADRLRGAMFSFDAYGWKSHVDLVKFRDIYPEIIVRHQLRSDGARIIVDFKTEDGVDFSPTKPANYKLSADTILHIDSYEQAVTICREISTGVSKQPIRCSGIDSELATRLEANFDVRVDKNNDGTYTIL